VRGGVRCALAPAAWSENRETFNATIIEQTGKESLEHHEKVPAFALTDTEKAASAAVRTIIEQRGKKVEKYLAGLVLKFYF
jgi:hypothetical protein